MERGESDSGHDNYIKDAVVGYVRTGGELDQAVFLELAKGNYPQVLVSILNEKLVDLSDEGMKQRWTKIMIVSSAKDTFDGMQTNNPGTTR
jgi:hypothetical protein